VTDNILTLLYLFNFGGKQWEFHYNATSVAYIGPYRIADVAKTCPLDPMSRTTTDAITTSRSKTQTTN